MQYLSLIPHIPLLLTLIRCAGAIFFPLLLYYSLGSLEPLFSTAHGTSLCYVLTGYPAPFLAIVYALLALTDFFDGILARKYGSESLLGRLLDPFADKLLVAGPLIVLAFQGIVSLPLVCIVIARELFVATLREYSAERGVSLRVQKIGKIKTVVQMSYLAAVIFFDMRTIAVGPVSVGLVCETFVILVTLFSALLYAITFYRQTRSHTV